MAKEQNLKPWQPGQSGNPSGYSRGRRFTDAILRHIDEKGLTDEIALVLLGKALGRREFLQFIDDNGKTRTRKPEYAWFRELMERIEGKATESASDGDEAHDEPRQIIIPDVDDRQDPD